MIYLIGGSGAPNYGDELIIFNWLKALTQTQPHTRLIVDNNNAANSRALYGSRFPTASFSSALKVIQPDKSPGSFIQNVQYGLDFLSKMHWKAHPGAEAALEQIRECKQVHLYGGGYINTTLEPSSGFLLGVLAALRNEFNIPLVATGIGLTPLQFQEGADLGPVRTALRAFDLLELRDVWSYTRVRDLIGEAGNALLGLDDAFLFPVAPSTKFPAKKRLHLSAYEWGNILEKPNVQSWLRAHQDAFTECVFWQGVPYLEQKVIASARLVVPELKVATVEDLLFDGPPAHPGDYMLTMRYHPHMVASRLGVHGQYAAESPYYMHKHGSVVRLGSRFNRLGVTPAAPSSVPQHFLWRESSWVEQKQALVRHLYG